MNGTIPIIQVVFCGLMVVAVLAVIGLVCSVLSLHALAGVKTRMATTERLDTVKAELERHLEHKILGATQPLTRAVDELRDSISDSNAAVVGIRTSNDTLVRQMDLMSHSLMKIHQEQMNRILDLAAGRLQAPLTDAAEPV
jgi:septal ring factor EnvC (AmiA/AmiB activator)